MYLNRCDLVNVIAANPRFEIPAKRVFARKFLQISTIVSNLHPSRLNEDLLTLQHFGHLITKLCVKFKLENIERLLEAIIEYCGENIIELEFCHFGVVVEESSILYVRYNGLERIGPFLGRLHTEFPNLRRLKFEYPNTAKDFPDHIVQSIPSLTSVAINGQFLGKNLIRFIELNGQLESLSLKHENEVLDKTLNSTTHITEASIGFLDASLPQLKYLEIDRVSIMCIPPKLETSPSRFENLKKLTFGSFATTNDLQSGYLTFLGHGIEELELYMFHRIITGFVEDITQFKKLKQLTLHLKPDLDDLYLFFRHRLVWSARGIQELILRNNELKKIIIRRHTPEKGNRYDYGYEHLECKYHDVINGKLNGAQWYVRGDAKCFTFSSETEN